MGGVAGPRSARMAARYADEYNTVFAGVDEVITRRDAIARACETAGRAPLPFSLMTGVLVGETEVELRSRAQRLAAKMGADAGELIARPPAGWIIGTIEPVAEQLRALRDAGLHRVMCQQLVHEDLEAVALLGERLAPLVA